MNVLFLSLLAFDSLNERNIYTDLLREFAKNGHSIYVISPAERRSGIRTHIIKESAATILRLKTGNIQKANIIEKGISTITIERKFISAIKEYFSDVVFDLVLYSTPPITFTGAIEYVKKRDGAKTYLLLKDIFPQNAVDIGLISKTGIKGIAYNHFRRQEKKLYMLSDGIGCMSKANVDYLVSHNQEVDPDKVEVCPNCVDVVDKSVDQKQTDLIRQKYGIPLNKTVFVYGGNLGKPQGIDFLIDCLSACSEINNAFFLIVGDGTEFAKLDSYANSSKQSNLKIMKRLPKSDYDTMVGACDVGMIFLDHRFTVPNFPSRLLAYMQAKIPVLAVTDNSTDIGRIIEGGQFGWWCESDNIEAVKSCIVGILKSDFSNKGERGYDYLRKEYSVIRAYSVIMNNQRIIRE